MQKKALYLGLRPKNWKTDLKLVHYPVIRTEIILSQELECAKALWPKFSHVILTSPTVFSYLKQEITPLSFKGKKVIAIGEGTAEGIGSFGAEPLIARKATQEGVISLLEELDLSKSFLFFPHSKRARPLLKDFFKERKIPFFSLDLYETHWQRPEPLPILEEFSEIIFTSPSTVEAFFKIFKSVPPQCKKIAIGPITEKVLKLFPA